MIETTDETSLSEQVKGVFRDAISYFGSTLSLVQARLAELALSSAVFLALITFAFLLGVAAFIVLNVALGVWLTHVVGSVALSLLILGGAYFLLAGAAAWYALRWLSRFRS